MRHSLIIVAAGAALAGCSAPTKRPMTTLEASQFRAPGESEAGMVLASPQRDPEPSEPAPVPVVSAAEASDGMRPAVSDGGADGAVRIDGSGPEMPPSTVVLVDEKVGDINGKPVYASAFLQPLAARFAADSRTLSEMDWLRMAVGEIKRKLDDEIREEILRNEALASMTEQERRLGLDALLERVRDSLRSKNQGSLTRAQEALKNELGLTVDEYLQRFQDEHLALRQWENAIKSRVNISWREIVQMYELKRDEFHTEPKAILRWIRVPTRDTEAVRRVNEAIARGDDFEAIARSEDNSHAPDTGGLYEVEVEDREPFLRDALNKAFAELSPGEIAGPIATGAVTNWLKFERIWQRSVPLYDIQLALANQKENIEVAKEFDRYIARLRERASFTDVREMTERLMEIAIERYNPGAEAAWRAALAAEAERAERQ